MFRVCAAPGRTFKRYRMKSSQSANCQRNYFYYTQVRIFVLQARSPGDPTTSTSSIVGGRGGISGNGRKLLRCLRKDDYIPVAAESLDHAANSMAQRISIALHSYGQAAASHSKGCRIPGNSACSALPPHVDRPTVSRRPFQPSIPRFSPPSFSPTSTVSPPPMRSISSSAISSGNSLASASHAVTPSLLPTSRSSFSPAKPPWPDNE
jgi:hypothetical protein